MSKNRLTELQAINNLKKVYIKSEEMIIDGMKETDTSVEELSELMGISPEKFSEYFKTGKSNFGFYLEANDILEKIKVNIKKK